MASDPQNPALAPHARQPFWQDRILWLLLALAVLGASIYLKLDSRVFPSASIDLKYSREQIAVQALGYARQFGYVKDKPIESTTFTFFNESKTFLEYELGLDQANRLMREKIPVWAWTTRFCEQYQLEQFRVWISPQGKLIAFSRTIEDERPMPSISHADALKEAQTFLVKDVQAPLEKLTLVSDKTTTQAHRDDHSFTWEDNTEDFKGAKLRYFVAFSGDKLTAYSSFLLIPDKWTRKYANMRSMNDLLQHIATIFYGTLQTLAVLVVPWALTRKQMRWRFAIFGGLVTALVGALDSINDYTSVVDSYSPTSSFSDYLLSYYFRQVIASLSSFVSGALLFGGADVIYRLSYPKRIALENYLSLKGFASREGRKAVLIGYCVFAVHLGWIIAYYMMGEKFKFWCPLGVDDYQLMGSAVPFFSAVSLGIHAATQEETIARVVALSLAEKLTGRFWIANLFQAASWGFMHSSYPQQPAYARGVELTIGGLFYGYIMRRYGLLPCFIGHYLVDAFLTVKPIFSASSPWLQFSGIIPIIPFAAITIASIIYDRHKKGRESLDGVSPDEPLFNESLPVHPVEIRPLDDEAEAYTYKPFSQKVRMVLAAVGVAGICFSFCTSTPLPGDKSRVTIDRTQAEARAKEILLKNGINPDQYKEVASLVTNISSDEMQYIFEKEKLQRTLSLANLTQPGFIWSVRFFKYMDSTEYKVELYGDGREYSFDITEDEDAPGDTVDKARAEKIAMDYVKRVHPEYKDLKLDKCSWDKRKNRTDYDVACYVPSLKVADADYKISLQVVGSKACNFSQAWQIPEQWTLDRSKTSSFDAVLQGLRSVAYFIMGGFVLWWGIGILRSGTIRWRPAILISIGCGLLMLPEEVNHWPVFFNNYETSVTKVTFIVTQVLQLITSCSSKMLSTFVSVALALAIYRLMSPRLSALTIIKAAFRPSGIAPRLAQSEMWFDGILVALSWVAVTQTKDSILDFVLHWFSPEIRTASLGSLANLTDYVFPVGSDLIDLIPSLVASLTMTLLLAGLYNKYFPRFGLFLIFVFVWNMVKYSYARHWQDFVINLIADTIQQIIFWIFVTKFARFNPVAYLVKVIIDDSLPLIYIIWIFGWPCFAPTFFSLIIYVLSPLLLLAYYRARNARLNVDAIASKASGEPGGESP